MVYIYIATLDNISINRSVVEGGKKHNMQPFHVTLCFSFLAMLSQIEN